MIDKYFLPLIHSLVDHGWKGQWDIIDNRIELKTHPVKSKITYNDALRIMLCIGIQLSALHSNEESILSVPELDVTFLNKFQLSNLFESVSISNTTFSIICLFGFMIFIQFIYLKKYFESRIN